MNDKNMFINYSEVGRSQFNINFKKVKVMEEWKKAQISVPLMGIEPATSCMRGSSLGLCSLLWRDTESNEK